MQRESTSRSRLLDAVVLSYLQQRGYSDAATALAAASPHARMASADAVRGVAELAGQVAGEAATESAMLNSVALFSAGADYATAYGRLQEWVAGSLDAYKARQARS